MVFASGIFNLGLYSTLAPAGQSAQVISDIFWWMCIGALIIWVIFAAILLYTWLRPHPHDTQTTARFIIGGGVVFPVIILSVLLYFSLSPLPELLRPAPEGSLRIEVSGAQWWWRVRYILENNEVVELANEIRVPVNEEVQFYLKSEDVIHSFWIPSLGGKMDMIPGRTNQLNLKATKLGTFGGICAEYCGASHALMKLKAVVMEKKDFNQWLKSQKKVAKIPETAKARRGQELFKSYGCISCHSVRGVYETGVLGPDLTHVGSRLSLGAGILPNEVKSFHRWIKEVDKIKPEVIMPPFDMISEEEQEALAVWLEGLK